MSEEKKDEVLIPSLVVGAITFYIYSFHSVLAGLVAGILTALATFALLMQRKIQLLRRITIISVTALMWTTFLLSLVFFYLWFLGP